MAKDRILVVEDEGIVALDLANRLRNMGYSVSAIVSSGEKAIRTAVETQPDLVLMDIRLKGDMDGIEAAIAIRARSDIPVVYVTALADADTLRRVKEMGFDSCITKPFEDSELKAAIKTALH